MASRRSLPLNFVVQHRTVLFRTAEGAKLVSAAINNRVLFETATGVTEGWSVIVKGTARILRTHEEVDDGRAPHSCCRGPRRRSNITYAFAR